TVDGDAGTITFGRVLLPYIDTSTVCCPSSLATELHVAPGSRFAARRPQAQADVDQRHPGQPPDLVPWHPTGVVRRAVLLHRQHAAVHPREVDHAQEVEIARGAS